MSPIYAGSDAATVDRRRYESISYSISKGATTPRTAARSFSMTPTCACSWRPKSAGARYATATRATPAPAGD
jgi:hypothetical protein